MTHSALQLLRYVIPELSCSANPSFNPQKECEGGIELFSAETAVAPAKAPDDLKAHAWSVEMRISQTFKEGQNFPYKFDLTILGFFTMQNGQAPESGEERFVRVNGSSMLYGIAREIVRSITATGPWSSVFLPTISFYQKDPNQKDETTLVSKAD